jgi:hypothetical protein
MDRRTLVRNRAKGLMKTTDTAESKTGAREMAAARMSVGFQPEDGRLRSIGWSESIAAPVRRLPSGRTSAEFVLQTAFLAPILYQGFGFGEAPIRALGAADLYVRGPFVPVRRGGSNL